MPMTQDRMIALLSEGELLLRIHKALIATLKSDIELALQDPESDKATLATVLNFTLDNIAHAPWEAHVVERYHFNREFRKNEKRKIHMRHRRTQKFYAPGSRGMKMTEGEPGTKPSDRAQSTEQGANAAHPARPSYVPEHTLTEHEAMMAELEEVKREQDEIETAKPSLASFESSPSSPAKPEEAGS